MDYQNNISNLNENYQDAQNNDVDASDKRAGGLKGYDRKNAKHHQKTVHKKNEKPREPQYSKYQKNQPGPQKNSAGTIRYTRRNSQDGSRQIRANVETIEDIIADIERIEKDIQFEIKQIRTIKLGL